MARARKTWKLVLISIILSILILAAFTAVFIRFIVPAYNISRDQVYNVLTKALPILIGLVFLEIALISSRRGDNEYKDNIDKLAPNAYDTGLYTSPVDDPKEKGTRTNEEFDMTKKETVVREVIKEVPVEVVKEVVKEVPVEVVREVPVEVEVIKEVPVEVVKEVVREVPVEVIKEVPEANPKGPEIIIKNNYTPVEIKIPEEVVVEKPVEVVVEKPVEVEVEKEVPTEEEVYLTFREALNEEIKAAKDGGYPLVLIALKGSDGTQVEASFDSPSFVENGYVYTILPYTRKKDVLRKAKLLEASIIEMDKSSTPESMIAKSLS